jgi:gluconate kinase
MDNFLRSSSSLIMSSSFIIRLFIICGIICNLSHQIKTIDALQPMESSSLFIVFGRPGSGKTTVANKAFESLSLANVNSNSNKHDCVELDLDVCISQEMKDNFGKGIYPSLQERNEFASGACDYVENQLEEKLSKCEQQQQQKDFNLSAIISFSFVNTDLRDIFRERFPKAKWILINLTDEECTKRINEREGHFYKGGKPVKKKEEVDTTNEDKDNSEWNFNPVTFPHIILDGNDSIEDNANNVVKEILGKIKAM